MSAPQPSPVRRYRRQLAIWSIPFLGFPLTAQAFTWMARGLLWLNGIGVNQEGAGACLFTGVMISLFVCGIALHNIIESDWGKA